MASNQEQGIEEGARDDEDDGILPVRPNGPTRKRARESGGHSRSTMSYPRRRATTACTLCRARKTKCNNARPQCSLCAEIGANCVYEDRSDLSSFDPASLAILDRVNEVIKRLDNLPARVTDLTPGLQYSLPTSELPRPLVSLDATYPAPSVSSTTFPENLLSLNILSPGSGYAAHESAADYLKIPWQKTNPDAILSWPVFESRYPQGCINDAVFETGSQLVNTDITSDVQRHPRSRPARSIIGFHERDVPRLIEKFLSLVHTKNPILEVEGLKSYALRVAEEGPGWDGGSCLVLLACAMGCVSAPFHVARNQFEGGTSVFTSSPAEDEAPDLPLGEQYYLLARKRIGLLDQSLLAAQCFFLCGVYLMYTLRPVDAWQNFVQAGMIYQVYLRKNTARTLDDDRTKISRLEHSLYWSCFKSEW
jgi:hypothetical protein